MMAYFDPSKKNIAVNDVKSLFRKLDKVRFWAEIRDDFRRFVGEIWRFETGFWTGQGRGAGRAADILWHGLLAQKQSALSARKKLLAWHCESGV